jgi:sugar phosphate isomerase/epimerase
MRTILATIALEPNRWTRDRVPANDIQALLPAIRAAGFEKLEVWQWHVTRRPLAQVRDIKVLGDALGVSFPYIAAYPRFLDEGMAALEQERIQAAILDCAEVLGANLKIMLGAGARGGDMTAAQVALTAERFGGWYRDAKSRGIAMCAELHGNTLFDPIEAGEAFMRSYPALDFSICYQPIDFSDLESSLALAAHFADRISHIHLQAPLPGGGFAPLAESRIDLRRLLPPLLHVNPNATLTLEFVEGCIQNGDGFDSDQVLHNARRDADFVERLLLDFGI